eukprot:CAMPEP_0181419906 /NCGR_PEP_ID=MMETSP1110-20121109/12313_1 /TAXON_ID=174948 /ORGANISM="Symbiodinium sp., Strain CCMP421" /LENGTH=68 /DNA_ID=CAMNT_0023542933 /DNA_START=222 /DNA_END=429 /DNA_ORIENTATION=-
MNVLNSINALGTPSITFSTVPASRAVVLGERAYEFPTARPATTVLRCTQQLETSNAHAAALTWQGQAS